MITLLDLKGQMDLVEAYVESIKGGVEKHIYLAAKVITSDQPIEGMIIDTLVAPGAISKKFGRWDDPAR